MPAKKRVRSEKLAALRESGALAATFHPDGSLASVTFAPVEAKPPAAKPPAEAAVAEEIIASPLWPKTDLDGIDGLPSFEGEQN